MKYPFSYVLAFMDLSVFYEVIVPLLEMDKTALICISTPQVWCQIAFFCLKRDLTQNRIP